MTQENKELLLKDLCGRLPYGVKVKLGDNPNIFDLEYRIKFAVMYGDSDKLEDILDITNIKPYLFPLSSMTEEQREELYKIGWYLDEDKIYTCFRNYDNANYKTHTDCLELINWCYENHLDINGLIPRDLAIDATDKNIY